MTVQKIFARVRKDLLADAAESQQAGARIELHGGTSPLAVKGTARPVPHPIVLAGRASTAAADANRRTQQQISFLCTKASEISAVDAIGYPPRDGRQGAGIDAAS